MQLRKLLVYFSSSHTPKLQFSTAINPERADLLVVMDTDSLEDPDWSTYTFLNST